MSVKAIETFYNGYRFRSRAEARWAVFFDAAGIRYLYEPEGVQLSDGTLYLPDFYLPDCKTWFEVKGVLNDPDIHKVKQLIADTHRPVVIGYPDLTFQACDAPFDDDFQYELGSMKDSGLYRCRDCGKLWFMTYIGYYGCECCGAYDGDHHFNFVLAGAGDKCEWDEKIAYAYDKARQARFEHGEKP